MAADTGDSRPVELEWLHRGTGAQVWLRLRGDASDADEAEEPVALVVAAPSGEVSHEQALVRRESRAGVFHDGRIDLADLLDAASPPEGRWRVRARTAVGTRGVRAAGDERLSLLHAHGGAGLAVEVADDGAGLALELATGPVWAEVEHVVPDDEVFHLEARLVGTAAGDEGPGGWQLVARRPGSAEDEHGRPTHAVAAEVLDRRLRAPLTGLGLTAGTWRLLVRSPDGTELPIGRHLDDLPRKDQTVAYPWTKTRADVADPARPHHLRPAYTPDDELVVEIADGAPDATDVDETAGPAAGPDQRPQRTVTSGAGRGGSTRRGKGATPRGTDATRRGKGANERGGSATRRGKGATPRGKAGTPRGKGATRRGADATRQGGTTPRQGGKRSTVVDPTASDALSRVVGAGLALAALAARATRLIRRRRPEDAETINVLLLNAYGMGGTIRTVWNLAEALAHRSDVQLVSVLREHDRPFFASDGRVRLRNLDERREGAALPGGLRGRVRAALARRPSLLVPDSEPRHERFSLLTDVLIVATLWRLPRGVLLTTRAGLNLIAARHAPGQLSLVGQEHLLFSAHRVRLQRELLVHYPRLDALAVLTEEDERDYRAHLGDGRPVVRHIPNAVPDVPFPRSDGQARHIVAAGRLAPAKGYDLLIPAFARVTDAHPDWSLRIYGSGPRRGQLERLVREHGLAERVHLMGRTERIWQEMAKGSIFALSSRFEGFGMVLLEAFQCGLPAVSFACPRGPHELVQHERNGLLVPEQDVDALADALIRMIEDDELRARCAAGALVTGERYAMVHIEQRWRELFRQATEP